MSKLVMLIICRNNSTYTDNNVKTYMNKHEDKDLIIISMDEEKALT